MPIYLFLVKHEFIFSVKKLMISLIEKAPYMLSPPFFFQFNALRSKLFFSTHKPRTTTPQRKS
ncbi:hypothetical protein EC551_00905 [Helicobacter pylori]|nr:hypothetical protein EC551_00905 [Helicobacter pylori]